MTKMSQKVKRVYLLNRQVRVPTSYHAENFGKFPALLKFLKKIEKS